MKTLLIIVTSIIVGYLLGIASFKDGFDKQAYSLQWGWGLREHIHSDCPGWLISIFVSVGATDEVGVSFVLPDIIGGYIA